MNVYNINICASPQTTWALITLSDSHGDWVCMGGNKGDAQREEGTPIGWRGRPKGGEDAQMEEGAHIW